MTRPKPRRSHQISTVFGLLLWLLLTAPALAHEGLTAAVPAPGDTVGSEVEMLQLWFGEPLTDFSVRVIDPDGNEIVESIDQPLDGLLEVQVPRLDVDGVYVIAYDIVYVDEATYDAVYRFTYDQAGIAPVYLEAGSTGSSTLAQVAIWVLVASTVVLALLLGWRLRQLQLARLDQAEDPGE